MATRPNVQRACKLAGVARGTAYQARNDHPEFKKAWDEAREGGLDYLEDLLYDAAETGEKGGVTAAIYLLNTGRYKRRDHQQPDWVEDSKKEDEEVVVGWDHPEGANPADWDDDDDED